MNRQNVDLTTVQKTILPTAAIRQLARLDERRRVRAHIQSCNSLTIHYILWIVDAKVDGCKQRSGLRCLRRSMLGERH